MLDCERTFHALRSAGVSFFAGVPDSLLKDLCAYITDHTSEDEHVIAANEGAAVAMAAGHVLAGGGLPLVYMQNSGLGNAVNPLLSLADPVVYAIPMLLLIGWRGEPGRSDEPQHRQQGEVMLAMLDAIAVPRFLLPEDEDDAFAIIAKAAELARTRCGPVALIVRAGTFAKYTLQKDTTSSYALTREAAIEAVVDAARQGDAIVATTGMASRELYELRRRRGQDGSSDFLTVGSMGHSSQIALAIALAKPTQRVLCLDGDGALIMHMGALALIGARRPANFVHVVLNNGAHDSVGGQPTVGLLVDIPAIALACGYRCAACADDASGIAAALHALGEGPSLIEIRIARGARSDLGRPTTTPVENKDAFMKRLART